MILGMLWLFASHTIGMLVLPVWAAILAQIACMTAFVLVLNYLSRNKPPPTT